MNFKLTINRPQYLSSKSYTYDDAKSLLRALAPVVTCMKIGESLEITIDERVSVPAPMAQSVKLQEAMV